MTPRWVPLIVGGKYNEAVRRSTSRASGAYAVRRRDSGTVVYVGESSRGVLWKTILRHFQPPGATRASFVVSDPSAYDIAIWKTSTGKRSRAAKRGADQRAMAAQARWIETLKPFHNVDDGKAKAEETAEYRATQARYEAEDEERGAFDGLINPAINVPRFLMALPKGDEAEDFDADALKVYASIGKSGTWRKADLVPLEDIDADPVWKPERLEALRAQVAAGEPIRLVHLVRESPASRWKINDGIHRIALAREMGMTHVAASCTTYATAAERAEVARKSYEHWRKLTMARKGFLSSKKSGHTRHAWADLRYSVLSENLAKAKKERDKWERIAKREARPTSENPRGPDIFAATIARRKDRDRRLAAWVAARGTRPYEAEGFGGVRVLVSPDPSKPGRWRVTRFQGGEPTGHNEAETFAEAATLAERDFGAPIPEASGDVTTRESSRNPALELLPGPPRTLTALGLLTSLSYKTARGRLVELRWTLAEAPTLAVDDGGRLRVVYLGRVVRPSSKVERAAYRKLHWGQEGRGEVAGGGVAVPPLRVLGRGVSVTYTTRKGVDRALVDYVHPWGEGAPASRTFVPPKVVEHRCGAKRCACEGAIAFSGGSYVVEERGIVG